MLLTPQSRVGLILNFKLESVHVFFINLNLNFVFSKSMNLNFLIKHSKNLDFFDLKLTKQKWRFVSGLYQHIV